MLGEHICTGNHKLCCFQAAAKDVAPYPHRLMDGIEVFLSDNCHKSDQVFNTMTSDVDRGLSVRSHSFE